MKNSNENLFHNYFELFINATELTPDLNSVSIGFVQSSSNISKVQIRLQWNQKASLVSDEIAHVVVAVEMEVIHEAIICLFKVAFQFWLQVRRIEQAKPFIFKSQHCCPVDC